MIRTVYIAGPMRGYDVFNFARFFYWQVVLEGMGFNVINPAREDCKRWIEDGWVFTEDCYEEVLQYDLSLISAQADALFVLNGWEKSTGAKREIEHAKEIGLEIMYQDKEGPSDNSRKGEVSCKEKCHMAKIIKETK